MAGEMTETMRMLRDLYREARARQQEAHRLWVERQELADDLEDECNQAYYGKVLATEGTPQEKKATAELAVANLRRQYQAAKTLADAAKKEHSGHTAALKTVESMGHAYNRELKTFGG